VKAREQVPATGRLLEEKVELENVTSLRHNLLPIIERLEDDPALRFLILKHGKPQAVLLSSQTYELMKKLLQQFQEHMAAMTQEERIENAVSQLRSERGGKRPGAPTVECNLRHPAALKLDVVLDMLQELKHDLHQYAPAKAKVEK